MSQQDYTAILIVNATAQEVFNNSNDVTKWWTDDFKGNCQKLNDEFTVQFDTMHISTQKIVEFVPNKKIAWLVIDSNLSFIKQKDEWTNTTIIFEISEQDNKTQLSFTHVGLVPAIECFKDCKNGWDHFIKGSLFKLLTTGKGTPGL